MNESRPGASADALISVIKSSLTAEGSQTFEHLVLYTSFGVVRGRIGLSFAQELAGRGGSQPGGKTLHHEVVELNDASVEHYSNHLPTARFDRLYVTLADVQGFALIGLPG